MMAPMEERALRELICEIGRRMYSKDLVAASEGNLSIRQGDRLLATPTGVCKGFLKPDDLVWTDLQGRQLEGRLKVSSEVLMHAAAYRQRPDIGAVCHAHPVHATSFAVAGEPLAEASMPEVVVALGCVPVAPYGTPSTQHLADSLIDLAPNHDAILLSNHGAITFGKDLEQAFFRMEILEHYAQISILTKVLGRRSLLPRPEVERLFDLRSKYGISGADSRDSSCAITAEDSGETVHLSRSELEILIETAIREVAGLPKQR